MASTEGKRNTIQRQLIKNAVKKLDIHATAEQVYDYIAEENPSIGRATVYRNLGRMSESGELLRISSYSGVTHYDHNCHEHYHFICKNCKRVIDMEGSLSDVFARFENTEGFDIADCHISFSGLCWDCKEKI